MLAVPCSTDSLLCIHSWVVWVWLISLTYGCTTIMSVHCCGAVAVIAIFWHVFDFRDFAFEEINSTSHLTFPRRCQHPCVASTALRHRLQYGTRVEPDQRTYRLPDTLDIHRCWWRTGVTTLSAYSSGWGSNFGLGAQSPKYRSALKVW